MDTEYPELTTALTVIDQMFTTVGWKQLADMVRAAQGSDMAVFARLENDPWYGGGYKNNASGYYSSVLGGNTQNATGSYQTIPALP